MKHMDQSICLIDKPSLLSIWAQFDPMNFALVIRYPTSTVIWLVPIEFGYKILYHKWILEWSVLLPFVITEFNWIMKGTTKIILEIEKILGKNDQTNSNTTSQYVLWLLSNHRADIVVYYYFKILHDHKNTKTTSSSTTKISSIIWKSTKNTFGKNIKSVTIFLTIVLITSKIVICFLPL